MFRRAVGKKISYHDEHHTPIRNSTFKQNVNASVLNNNDERGRKFEKFGASGLLIATAIGSGIVYYACKLFFHIPQMAIY